MDTSTPHLLRHLAKAVRADDRDGFNEITQHFVAHHGQNETAEVINNRLPLILDVKYISRLLHYLAGDEYIEAVRSFLIEMATTLSGEGFVLGTDFSYCERDGVPHLRMSQDIAFKVENMYEPNSWKWCLPYLTIVNS